jgi:hypothetical protein
VRWSLISGSGKARQHACDGGKKRTPCPVTTSARRFLKRGLVVQPVLDAGLVTLSALGVRPAFLARWYGVADR